MRGERAEGRLEGGYLLILAVLATLLVGFALVVRADAESYFDPEDLKPSAATCEYPEWNGNGQIVGFGARRSIEPVIDTVMVGSTSALLRSAGEGSLFRASTSGELSDTTIHRFLFMPAQQWSVVVRVAEAPTGEMVMRASLLKMRQGLVEQQSRSLTMAEAERVRAVLAAHPASMIEPHYCLGGFDGQGWLFETASDGQYDLVNKWSPVRGPVYEIGGVFLGLAEFESLPEGYFDFPAYPVVADAPPPEPRVSALGYSEEEFFDREIYNAHRTTEPARNGRGDY